MSEDPIYPRGHGERWENAQGERVDPPSQIAIDRTAWKLERQALTEEDGTCSRGWLVTVDGYEAGRISNEGGKFIWAVEEGGSFLWALDGHAANPFSEDPFPWEPTLELAFAKIREAWALYWGQCGSCGDDTTEEDRRWLVAGADSIDVFCANCREGGLRLMRIPERIVAWVARLLLTRRPKR